MRLFLPSRTLTLDVESTSPVDLSSVGAARYWEDPETRLICVCFAIDDGPVVRWTPGMGAPPAFRDEFGDGFFRVVAHNWLFEYWAWKHRLVAEGWKMPPLWAWDCTMARALYWGLPAALIDVAGALHLSRQIDPDKKARIKRMGRPRTLSPLTYWDQTEPDRLEELLLDCENDVATERELDKALPALPPAEREIFLIDGEINQRGILVDLSLIDKLQTITNQEQARLNLDMAALTGNRVKSTNQVARIMDELENLGAPVPSLAKADVKAAIEILRLHLHGQTHNGNIARKILECRQEAAKASTAKLKSMRAFACADGRARGMFQYGGAGRTLRWAGRGPQPQNFPRGTVKFLDTIFMLIEQGHITIDELRALVPAPLMDVVASMLRGGFVAEPGHVLVSGDLSQIEARVVAWLAGQDDILSVFARGDDVYTYTAGLLGSDNRQFGKVLVLACGFGMGWQKFQETAATYGVILSDEEAQDAVAGWRTNNTRIVDFWWEIDRAFKLVANSPHGTAVQAGRFITIRKTRKAVRISLPSGRELTYQNTEIVRDPDTGRDEITFMGVDPKTKKWSRQRTYGGKLVENITQAVARDVMRDAMITLHRQRGNAPHARVPPMRVPQLIGTVHDELIGEAPEQHAVAALTLMLAAMRTTPTWAPGLPVAAEGWTGKRYRK
jgi:DNA polymerase